MNGFIRKGVAMVCLAACVPILGGCYCYREHRRSMLAGTLQRGWPGTT